MSKDITKLHPRAQIKLQQLLDACTKEGITLKVIECNRTVAEQNALYNKGRTAPGSIVTNCRGTDYKSMHQWGVAFDVGINMDTDNDGDIDITDIYCAKLLNRVGQIGQKIGLEWGGSWKTIVDKPHFQLPTWGSTAALLRKQYGTPEAFKKTWPKKQPAINIAKYSIATVIANNGLTLRKAKGKNLCGNRITAIPKNSKITILKKSAETQRINGVNYTMAKIQYNTYTGYVAQQYLKF